MRPAPVPLALVLALATLPAATSSAAPEDIPVPAPAARTLSLEEALQQARAHQPLLRQARAGTQAAEARVDQARSPLLPQVNATVGYQRTTANFAARPGAIPRTIAPGTASSSLDTFNFFNFGITASQLVYDFGQAPRRRDAARATAEAQADTERATALQVVLNVRTAYFAARAARALVVVASETLANQRRHLAQVQGFVEVGTRPEIDLAQSRTDVANAEVQLIDAQNSYDITRAQLNQAMGIETPVDFDVTDEELGPVPGEEAATEALIDQVMKGRPEVSALENRIRAQELTVRAIRGAYGPSLGVSTGLTDAGTALDRLTWNWNAGVNLTWPIFQGGVTRAQGREAMANLAALRAELDTFRQQLRLEIEQARLAVRASKGATRAAGEAAANARVRLQLAEGRYQAGVGNIIELGDAQVALTNARAQEVQAHYRLSTARAQLLKALGRV